MAATSSVVRGKTTRSGAVLIDAAVVFVERQVFGLVEVAARPRRDAMRAVAAAGSGMTYSVDRVVDRRKGDPSRDHDKEAAPAIDTPLLGGVIFCC